MKQQEKLSLLARSLLFFVVLYRKTQPFRPRACRFYPSCSHYAQNAIEKHGAIGIFIAFMRILRCNPFFKGGYDPVR
ncbi:membrane protein insertion efficiency factor YidD [candidate division WOR-1 bacterium RIFOXYC2_FULL_37_10]|uniref:Putative membrane protein insertion efficiency factor n=1 Tax=candidate division WOR-1 bacterium RIFOXYB2_FULL_37_13 TaxID=1802579 RepID=A0A1F4SEI2_UNCSA|nr:MAG: membrane protein insertion efficiency factor YidD [candidate division WOR-1 bacterium RIFOXYB2_FULL_37_13]OGC32526.1 MAG: membrane protein insertion efficiency factor YidD [candidate division WOR-1 bacterium RIFOXYC2_FULL_37_10]